MANPNTVMLVVCILCLINGVIMLSVGAAAYVAESENIKLIGVNYLPAFNMLITAGAIGVIVSILGLVGILIDKCLLVKVFMGLTMVVFIFALTAGALGFTYHGEVDENILTNLKLALNKYGLTGQSEMTKSWQAIQEKEACCAIHFFTDWRKTEYAHNRYDKVPQSCCKNKDTCNGFGFTIDQIVDKGCLGPLRTSALRNLLGAGITGIVLALVELILFIVGVLFCKKLGGTDIYAERRVTPDKLEYEMNQQSGDNSGGRPKTAEDSGEAPGRSNDAGPSSK